MDSFSYILGIIVDVFSAISIAGALFTILTFAIFKDLRTYPIKLVMYMCTCIFLAQLFFLLVFYVTNLGFCIPAAVIYHYFFLATFAWTFCVAFNFLQMIVKHNREAESYEKYYHLGSWLIPAIICGSVGAAKKYGHLSSGICYMTSSAAIFGAFFLPGLIVVSANAIIFFFITREIHDTISQSPVPEQREKKKEYKVYYSIFASIGLSWAFGFLMLLFPENNIGRLIFLVLFSITTPLQGFFVFVAYCINMKVMGRWAGLFGKVFPVFRRWEHLGSTRSTGSYGQR